MTHGGSGASARRVAAWQARQRRQLGAATVRRLGSSGTAAVARRGFSPGRKAGEGSQRRRRRSGGKHEIDDNGGAREDTTG
uniref:Uncharacterized protein n=1 Tax=Oryza sativa subsp. japonica TaxID=39947 RepID=Q5Z6R5_ORYSJ|nr:hypothetical protein [Oryza sativa Japonica Group]BAD54354.1 hypothetical protein [Oryza sativa Japonica Group]